MRSPLATSFRLLTAHDAVLAGGLAALLLGSCLAIGDSVGQALAGAALCLPLCWRSRRPLAALAAVTLGSVAYLGLVTANPVYVVPLALGLYAAAVNGNRRRTLVIGVALVLPFVVVAGALRARQRQRPLAGARAPLAAGPGAGDRRGGAQRPRNARPAAERAELETLRRIEEERGRIARDVHDMVATAWRRSAPRPRSASTSPKRRRRRRRGAGGDPATSAPTALEDLRHALRALREGGAPRRRADALDRQLPPGWSIGLAFRMAVVLRMEGSPLRLPAALQRPCSGSSRSASPTRCATLMAPARGERRGRRGRRQRRRGRRRPRRGGAPGRAAGSGRAWSACASGPRRSAAGSRRAARGWRSGSARCCRWKSVADDQVLLADDQVLLRGSLATLIEQEDDMDRRRRGRRRRGGGPAGPAHRPDVVLMDVRMPDSDGIEATARILADPPLRDAGDHVDHFRARRLRAAGACVPGRAGSSSRASSPASC